MWRASPDQYIKHKAFNNPNDKHYNLIFNNVKTRAQRMSKRKWKRANDALAYGKRFDKRMYRFEGLPYSDRMGAGKYKPKWTLKLLWRLLFDYGIKAFQDTILIALDVLLIDVSKWQGRMNWAQTQISQKNVQGAWIKAGQAGYADPEFFTNWANAKTNNIPRGSYFFFDSRMEPKAQATLWWQLINNDIGELPHSADLEESYGGPYSGPVNWRIFLEEFQRLSGFSNDKIIIYTGYYYWISNAPTNTTQLAWFGRFELWLAWYTSNPANVLIPRPWTIDNFIAWQSGTPAWGAELGAQSAEIDVDWFNGTQEEFLQRFNLQEPPTPPPVPIPTLETVRRYNTDCHIFTIPRFTRAKVTNTQGRLENVLTALAREGADIGINVDGWPLDSTENNYRPLSLAASDGNLYQPDQYDWRWFLNITQDNEMWYSWNDFGDLYNAGSGTQMLVMSGDMNPLFDEQDRTARHARSSSGIDSHGNLILIKTDGVDRTPNAGLTIEELATLYIERGAMWAMEHDGGSSSQLAFNDTIIGEDSSRGVVQHLLL